MVFSSIQPAYLDHSSNWQHQQQNHQLIGSSSGVNSLLPPQSSQPGLLQPPPQPHGSVGAGSIRPNSMAERARMANLSIEMAQQKCPRCESSNTKFCYFNNYSLSQPRHFCKNCRRYWTRGGALRNVPVGGGCRRNKRSKSTSSKSTASQGGATSSSTSGMSTNNGAAASLLGLTTPNLSRSFMSPLGQLSENFHNNEMGLNNYNGSSSNMVSSEMGFHSHLLGGGNMDMWRLQQQFPFLGGSDSQLTEIYGQFQGGEGFVTGNHHHQQDMRPVKFSSAMLSTQMASVKMEDNAELNLSRQFLGGGIQGNDQWNTAAAVAGWTDLSSFSSSSTSNPL